MTTKEKQEMTNSLKQEAIELLKKETTDLANVYKKDGGFVLSGTYNNEKKETYNKEQREIKEIRVGDYFIARKPKGDGVSYWISEMDKFDGVIQECGLINERGYILSKTTFMDMWYYLPEWCEKVSPGDVMKIECGDLFIFREVIDGKTFRYAYFSPECNYFSIKEDVYISGKDPVKAYHATPEESQPLFDALEKQGKRWNAEKKRVEDMVWKPKPGDVCVNELGSIFIYKTKTTSTIHFYAALYGGHFFTNHKFICSSLRLATYEERCKFFERLVKEGYKWDAKKLKLTKQQILGVKEWEPKEGEFVAHKDGWIHIHKVVDENMHVKHYVALAPNGNIYYKNSAEDRFVGYKAGLRGPATESERQKLIDALLKEGKRWNAEKMCVEDITKPKTAEEYYPTLGFTGGKTYEMCELDEKYEKDKKELLKRAQEQINDYYRKNVPTTYFLSTEEIAAFLEEKFCKRILNGKK